MALAISHEDTQILLKDKNVLVESTLDKYRTAGQITQTALRYLINLINDSYHYKKTDTPLTISQLCFLTDSFINQTLESFYKNKVNERGISHPTTIDVDELTNGWSPELDDPVFLTNKNKLYTENFKSNGIKRCVEDILQYGDIVKLTVGCHIDGYTSQVSHTIVISPTTIEQENIKPQGPLLGGKADAIAAAHIATESLVTLLGCALHPEKLPSTLHHTKVTGSLIRTIVDTIVSMYNCSIVPGSKIRRIRRFLAGQNEGVVAEREFKGCVWYEANQEARILQEINKNNSNELLLKSNAARSIDDNSAVPTDDFVVAPGEVYLIDLKVASLAGTEGLGLVTLEQVENFNGTTTSGRTLVARPTQYVRDYTQQHNLKLKTSRQVLNKLDKLGGVYPVKLTYLSPFFTKEDNTGNEANIIQDLKSLRLGMSEIVNNFLATTKPIQICKFIPWKLILSSANPTGSKGFDAVNPTLPGFEVPLPQLNIPGIKLKSLLKDRSCLTLPVARECCTVALSEEESCLIRLTGGSRTCQPSWIHSQYQLDTTNNIVQGVFQLAELSKDERFGIKIRETLPMKKKLVNMVSYDENMMA
ncbi:related to Probable metalloprotease ARX1 [Saccharomycodes ludwigii]|uniref:Probable metalloprotease ARX1 n=1 Tax=Saccharomycodes ludwigii TaxID=36035 RepID=A0A376B932_9ASCO|nr:hypothetical protein SCDLUD_001683 [Saccharomycodes ludwigii]KAH3901899.1 hypothetical protein SCDLUD_001683 [Saccharomycodes ludwigii]SSD61079.1 related to Probable metalloprotease ARX1 [Saccharomycodes ludwigii]